MQQRLIGKRPIEITLPRLNELVQGGEGIAIVEAGLSLGGGCLSHFGINSNTSANGFVKCLYRKKPVIIRRDKAMII